ncbi:mechanosensitive ion channel family protein [Geodermatophilus sp. DSM 44513]|uniref:mechanosensitive ion channel family protein n=1 Tax=Geodermatophilus sp. DSM 44513 TaxID=1528104 RepID=UPI00126DDCEA|nr:mechanosensitive ion channel domain-containing protein [Geodermatophilus sp. DSM 44513]WNV77654.1 mechanosensitive ion channel [Geodermatophilus sp. DSM 44513]
MTIEVFGQEIRLLFLTEENGLKLLLTAALVFALLLLRWMARGLSRLVLRGLHNERARFWTRQGINLVVAVLLLLGVLSIWFDDPARLATGIGLVTAGLAFALQKVITAFAGYVVILRGDTFNVGDRITMGGVRGDVIALGFIRTTIMEMGQPPAVQPADPAQWVRSRQYTGRVVTVTNDKVFDEAVYNYTRDFPYLWEELTLPVKYTDDRERAEQILLAAARRHTVAADEMPTAALERMQHRYFVRGADLEPRVYWRLTDNWLELTVRFLTGVYGVRDVKDAMSREVLAELDAAGIGLASATFEVVGLPPLRVRPDAGRPA